MRIYGITEKQAEEITAKDKYEMDKFWNKHCAQVKDPLTLIVKCHLFIESCMAELLTLYLPNSEKILEKSSFANKLNLVESLNIIPNSAIIRKIRGVNRLRNNFVHNLDKKLELKDIDKLIEKSSRNQETNPFKNLLGLMHQIIGYLHAMITITKLFPFIRITQTHNKIIKNDKGFIHCLKKIKELYPECRETLYNLKM